MFVELGTFLKEKELYNQKVIELKNTTVNPDELTRLLEEERLKFKGVNRKYLPTAISVIKNTFQVDYSLYKIGRDVDANFNTIETNVNKTQSEIAVEMNQFVQQANGMGLTEEQVSKLNLAIDIIMTYVDDTAVSEDQNKAFYLNHSKVVASSLDLPVTQKMQEPVTMDSVQHNPYANQPLNLNNAVVSETQPVNSAKEPLVDPFANLYGANTTQVNVPVQPVDNTVYQASPVVSQMQQTVISYQPQVQTAVQQPQFIQQETVQLHGAVQPQPMVMPVQQQVQIPQAVPQAVVQTAAQVVMPETNLIPDNEIVIGKEKNGVVAQIVCAILVPIMAAISSAIIYFISDLDFVSDLFTDMPDMLNQIASCLLIGTVCLLCAGPIIKIARSRTVYLERFMVPTTLLSLPAAWLLLELISEIQINSTEMAMHFAMILLLAYTLYFPFVMLLFVRAFVNSDNSKDIKAPIWSIFDKLGMILVTYIFFIPAAYMIISLFGNFEILDEILNVIYFMDNPSISDGLGKILLIASSVAAGFIMITRSLIIKRVGSAK